MANMQSAWNDYHLARRLEWGEGCPQDPQRAAVYYRRAALRGLELAQEALGYFYATGQGVERNDALAVEWFRLAAEQGCCAAQHNLGVMYAEGRGVEADAQEAVKWFYSAARNGSEVARDWLHNTRQLLRDRLSDEADAEERG